MDKDIVGSHVIGIEKLREALKGSKLVVLAGRSAWHFIMEHFGVDTRGQEYWLGSEHPGDIAECVEGLQLLTASAKARGALGLLASNNPLVLNELQPEQVFLVTHWGARVTPITETINFTERAKVYALGELWLSYLHKTADDSEPSLIPEVAS